MKFKDKYTLNPEETEKILLSNDAYAIAEALHILIRIHRRKL